MTTVVLASPIEAVPSLMAAIGAAIATAGIAIRSVDLDPRCSNDAVQEQGFKAALAGVSGPVILGGFSLGGRIAARLCAELSPVALLCFGYPFHAPRRPSARHGLEALSRVRVPTLIVQGTRDSHGSEADVRGYSLPDAAQVVWLRDGNHRFVPRERSGYTHDQHIAAAGAAAITFIRGR
ncbi:alpha/beta family hydrolase [Enhygromyxa salina]|uniref:Alpha/beta hydrolase family protein n=1 Tax=Enhygromyxa salina TaxID=215803 RepID=A0A2S9YME3_9BACT|nr:alpha/beta family hydrolase [Enhygromyxa salina]PRQ06253.1 Alpha/beta hydrolase family protein [Enhygromyxa salina]